MVPLISSTPALKVNKEILASKTRKNIFEEKMNETNSSIRLQSGCFVEILYIVVLSDLKKMYTKIKVPSCLFFE